MTEIGFYHLTATSLDRALPKLLERTLESGERAVVLTASEERTRALNGHLWTYHDRAWLPHGSESEGHPELQPIWLTAREENPNGAGFLFLTDGAETADAAAWTRIFDLFDGRDEAAVAAARNRWRAAKAAGHELTYWKQDEHGRWGKLG